MLILNYAHPITADQRSQIEALIGGPISDIKQIKTHVDLAQPFAPQIIALADAAGLSGEEWSGAPLLINPPALNFAAVALLAELHGRMGYFPACLRMRPIEGSIPPRYEVAEILNLQDIRHAARGRR